MELAAARGITQPGGLTSQPQTSNYPAVFTACFQEASPCRLTCKHRVAENPDPGLTVFNRSLTFNLRDF
jgi:hypothetical protein